MGKKPHRARAGRASEDEEAVEQVGVQLEESRGRPDAARPDSAGAASLEDPGFVDLVVAGTRTSGEFRCAECGYGAVVQRVLPHCPMCTGTVWESRERRGYRLLG
jgi:lipopolysaccharide biosynthesis regulator YciM